MSIFYDPGGRNWVALHSVFILKIWEEHKKNLERNLICLWPQNLTTAAKRLKSVSNPKGQSDKTSAGPIVIQLWELFCRAATKVRWRWRRAGAKHCVCWEVLRHERNFNRGSTKRTMFGSFACRRLIKRLCFWRKDMLINKEKTTIYLL